MPHSAQDPSAFLQAILNAILLQRRNSPFATRHLVPDIFHNAAEFPLIAVRRRQRFTCEFIDNRAGSVSRCMASRKSLSFLILFCRSSHLRLSSMVDSIDLNRFFRL